MLTTLRQTISRQCCFSPSRVAAILKNNNNNKHLNSFLCTFKALSAFSLLQGCWTGISCLLHQVEESTLCFVPKYAGEGNTRADGTTGEVFALQAKLAPSHFSTLILRYSRILNQSLNWPDPNNSHVWKCSKIVKYKSCENCSVHTFVGLWSLTIKKIIKVFPHRRNQSFCL